MTGERDELPEGWDLDFWEGGDFELRVRAIRRAPKYASRWDVSNNEAIAAAWRIVDAEREAPDGR